MLYDLDSVCDRKNTDCAKWDYVKPIFGHDDVLPLWVADMDFPAAQPIVDALKNERSTHFTAIPSLEPGCWNRWSTASSENSDGRSNRNG